MQVCPSPIPGPSTTQAAGSHGSMFMGSFFSGLSNCSITILPQNLTINNHMPSDPLSSSKQEADVDVNVLLDGIDLDQLFC